MATLDLIFGPMMACKTTELLRRLIVDTEIGCNVKYITHSHDTRLHSGKESQYSTHNPLLKHDEQISKIKMIKLSSMSQIFDEGISNLSNIDVIGIDEAQFFDDLYEVVKTLVEKHSIKVIVSGLDGDSNRQTFGKILSLIPLADSVVKILPYCMNCSTKKKRVLAPFTYKKSMSSSLVDVGGCDKYMPVCRECYLKLTI